MKIVTEDDFRELLLKTLLDEIRGRHRVALFGSGTLTASHFQSKGGTAAFKTFAATSRSYQVQVEALAEFGPDSVLLQDIQQYPDPIALLGLIIEAAPGADLLFWFRNASATPLILGQLLGEAPTPGTLSDDEVGLWFEALGLEKRSRRALPFPSAETPFAAPVARALKALFRQLNPSTDDDFLVYRVGPAPAAALPTRLDLDDDTLSVLFWSDGRGHEQNSFLNQSLFSIVCQEYRPIQLLTVAPTKEGAKEIDWVLERYRALENFEHLAVQAEDGQARCTLLNSAIARASGRYLTFLESDQVVFPSHYPQLVGALKQGEGAWALAKTKRAYLTPKPGDASFIQTKDEPTFSRNFTLSSFQVSRPPLCSLVIDRKRLGRFPLLFEQDVGPLKNDPLFAKLSAIFRPEVLDGPPSCEQRILPHLSTPLPRVPAGLQVLLGADELMSSVQRAERYYALIDRLKIRFRSSAPRTYATLKALFHWRER